MWLTAAFWRRDRRWTQFFPAQSFTQSKHRGPPSLVESGESVKPAISMLRAASQCRPGTPSFFTRSTSRPERSGPNIEHSESQQSVSRFPKSSYPLDEIFTIIHRRFMCLSANQISRKYVSDWDYNLLVVWLQSDLIRAAAFCFALGLDSI